MNIKRKTSYLNYPDRFIPANVTDTYATNAIRIGDPIKTVSENLGHATVAFTLDEYGHVTPAMKQDSADRMQRLIDSCS